MILVTRICFKKEEVVGVYKNERMAAPYIGKNIDMMNERYGEPDHMDCFVKITEINLTNE